MIKSFIDYINKLVKSFIMYNIKFYFVIYCCHFSDISFLIVDISLFRSLEMQYYRRHTTSQYDKRGGYRSFVLYNPKTNSLFQFKCDDIAILPFN